MKLFDNPNRVLYVVVAFLVLAFCYQACSAGEVVDPDYDAKYKAWNIACTIQTEYSCEGVLPPSVTLIYSKAWRGGYNGGNEIFFNPEIPKDKTEGLATRVHEMLHYLEFQVGDISYRSQKDICDTENFAYTTVNRWLEKQGRSDLQIHDWWKNQPGHRGYWKCIPWYGGYPDFVIGEPEFG